MALIAAPRRRRMRRPIACGRLRSRCWHGIDPIQTQP